ncbi:MAG: ACP phosphodiesterase [Cytophagaceae bacterium]|nr:ACP phosphodiesterase [Cytophagaceae bacterium]
MNYLLNFYTSKSFSEKTIIGNFIGERVKPSQYYNYPSEIISGIYFNKGVNNFIQNSVYYNKSKERLDPRYGKYSSKIIDIVYDHFLALNWKKYNSCDLNYFIKEKNMLVIENYSVIPYKLKKLFPQLIMSECLNNLATVSGLHNFMKWVTTKDTFRSSSHFCLMDLTQNYSEFNKDFELFMEELEAYVSNYSMGELKEPVLHFPFMIANAS